MRDWLANYKGLFDSWKFKVIVVATIIVLLIGIFVGIEFYGYAAATLVFVIFYFFAKQAESEKILSPDEKSQMEQDLNKLVEEADLIKTHIEDNKGDLEAKLLLHSVEKEISVIKVTLLDEQEKK